MYSQHSEQIELWTIRCPLSHFLSVMLSVSDSSEAEQIEPGIKSLNLSAALLLLLFVESLKRLETERRCWKLKKKEPSSEKLTEGRGIRHERDRKHTA